MADKIKMALKVLVAGKTLYRTFLSVVFLEGKADIPRSLNKI